MLARTFHEGFKLFLLLFVINVEARSQYGNLKDLARLFRSNSNSIVVLLNPKRQQRYEPQYRDRSDDEQALEDEEKADLDRLLLQKLFQVTQDQEDLEPGEEAKYDRANKILRTALRCQIECPPKKETCEFKCPPPPKEDSCETTTTTKKCGKGKTMPPKWLLRMLRTADFK